MYVADGFHHRLTVFDAKGNFLEAWGWGVADEVTKAFEHCGPADPIHKTCAIKGLVGEGAGQFSEPEGVAVDQANGDVFVLDRGRIADVVQVFNANGELISGFGEQGGQGKPVGENSELIRTPSPSGIAVDSASGEVFLVDANISQPSEGRVMVFAPTPVGNFSHYTYVSDFAQGEGRVKVAIDDSGNAYVSSRGSIYKFAAGNLSVLDWEHSDPKEIEGMTVNPEVGEGGRVFYFTGNSRKFHELNSATGEQVSEWPGVEMVVGGKNVREEETPGLAFDPGLKEDVSRPDGVLYAIDHKLKAGLVFAEPPLFPPSVESVSVADVGIGSALLQAQINPHGFDTNYRFQYGTEDCVEHACTKEVPVPLAGDAGDSGKLVAVSASVTGLAPGTMYYFRVVASNHCHPAEPLVVCSVSAPKAAPADSFMTFPTGGSGLSDGRVFELVSPSNKNGGEVFPLTTSSANCELCLPGVQKERFPMQSNADGSAVVYEGDPFAATGDAIFENEYLSTRDPGGVWSVPPRDLSPALEGKTESQGYQEFSADLSRGVLYEIEHSFADAPDGYPDLYLQDTGNGVLRALVTEAPSNRGAKEFKLTFAGASSDFGHLAFEANGALATESAVGAPEGLSTENNLYEWVKGGLRLVNILPGGSTEAGAAFGSGNPNFSHAVSADGSRLFWTDENHANGHFGHVYVRVNGEKTLEVPDGEGGAFLAASMDGSRVLLNDGRVYRVGSEEVLEETDLTGGHRGFQGILGTSEDLSSVYFIDTAVLTGTEANDQGAVAGAGDDNLYLWRDGSIKFVGTLSGTDNTTGPSTGDWKDAPLLRTAEVTPDGRYAAFMSEANLIKGTNSAGFSEVYEYDASTERLVCASCNPTKERPVGSSVLSTFQLGSVQLGSAGTLPQPMYLSENGRLFFGSYDHLSPTDTNGTFEDVYEYEPGSLGSCTQAGGCISLISSGQEETDSTFINATPSGSDVFFATRSQLVPRDQDDLMDLYDARIGGIPPSPLPSPPCSGEECKGAPAAPPLLETLPSTIVTGSGNIVPSPPSPTPPPVASPTRAQLLVKALSACRRAKSRRTKRVACEKRARGLYGPVKRAKNAGRTKKTTGSASRYGTKAGKKP
jgi:hypothetical protein